MALIKVKERGRETVNLGRRNMIINGAMQVAQRSNAAVSNTNFFSSNIGYETIDRWGHWASGANKFTVQQVTDAPPGFYYSLKVTSLGNETLGAGDGYTISQRVEAQNLYQASLGTANAKNLVVSFWVKSTTTGTFGFYALGYGLAQSFVQNFTINSANTWEYKTINIPGPTSGTYSNTPSNYGLEIGFTLGSGTTWQTSTLGSWQNSNFKISSTTTTNVLGVATRTLQLTGVQLELGDKATPFEHRSYGEEVRNCQRYYTHSYNTYETAGANTVSANSGVISLKGTSSTLIVSIIALGFPTQLVTIYLLPTLGIETLFFLNHHKEVAVACFIPSTTSSANSSASFLLSQK